MKIITCPEWGAAPPRGVLEIVGPATRIIFHHTAGHHAEISVPDSESYEEARRYALAIQQFHFSEGWADSGHNFLVCRNGMIFQGRWHTVSAIQGRQMVRSAHCPGFNGQVGIEHEHTGHQEITSAQFMASAWLQAWIAKQYGKTHPLPVDPHSAHFPTSCPSVLARHIPAIRAHADDVLTQGAV